MEEPQPSGRWRVPPASRRKSFPGRSTVDPDCQRRICPNAFEFCGSRRRRQVRCFGLSSGKGGERRLCRQNQSCANQSAAALATRRIDGATYTGWGRQEDVHHFAAKPYGTKEEHTVDRHSRSIYHNRNALQAQLVALLINSCNWCLDGKALRSRW
jgi:hypothetical protein